MFELDPAEGRVVGSLIEKQLTTPQQYPLSLNALTLACNQTSNRDPVVSYGESDVQATLDSLKAKGLVRFVLPSHGRSVVRYRHVLDEKLALDARQLSLLGVLLLRGPQTVGELRTRTERMADFDTIRDIEHDLEGLTRRDPAVVQRLDRRPGQKEERWTQLLAEWAGRGGGEPPAHRAADGGAGGGGAGDREPLGGGPGGRGGGLDELRQEMAALREEVAALRDEIERLKADLGE